MDKYSYSQMVNDISALASCYPGTVTVKSIGKSADGRDIYDVIVGNPNASKKILFQGAIHAREYIVVPLMMQQLEYLAAGFTNNGTYMTQPLSNILGQVAFHFVPMLNPDGVTNQPDGREWYPVGGTAPDDAGGVRGGQGIQPDNGQL